MKPWTPLRTRADWIAVWTTFALSAIATWIALEKVYG